MEFYTQSRDTSLFVRGSHIQRLLTHRKNPQLPKQLGICDYIRELALDGSLWSLQPRQGNFHRKY